MNIYLCLKSRKDNVIPDTPEEKRILNAYIFFE